MTFSSRCDWVVRGTRGRHVQLTVEIGRMSSNDGLPRWIKEEERP